MDSYIIFFIGYCSVFNEIGENFGPFDLAFIPIGLDKLEIIYVF